MFRCSLFYLAAGLTLAAPCARADEAWNAHVQATYVWQAKPAFDADYTGPASLAPWRETGYSFSATAAFGLRPWAGAELYFDPEVVQGKALSGLHGFGGMTNGEQQKTSGTSPTFYRARLFLRQTWNLGGEMQAVAADMNQLAGSVASRRVVLTAGNLAASDIFDANSQAHDARGQFLNWALVAHGAWDFAADARGYTWGAALEYVDGAWAVRAGRFMLPRESNGPPLERNLFRHYGDQVELERHHAWRGQAGTVRVLAFRDRARMGSFRDALAATAPGEVPDVGTVRRERAKTGFGLSLDQALTGSAAMFARASRNDGQSETYAFAEIERSVSAGATVQVRRSDTLGVALVRNGLSQAHRDYLAAGGAGAFIGDGRLDYHPEQIAETYYRIGLGRYAALSLDWQHVANPAYNGARGPVEVYGVRLHAQY